MNLWWSKVTSIFLPQIRTRQISPFADDPQASRLERPYQSTTQTRWLQSDIETATLMADQGDLAMVGRLARSMRGDGTYSGLLSTRAGGLVRLPRIFRGTPDVLEALEPTDDVSLFDRIYNPKELELMSADGDVCGVAIGEHIYLPDSPIPVFVRLDPEFLRYRWSEDRWYYRAYGGDVVITPGDGRWVLHMPGGYQAPWTNGLWRSLGRAYVAKEHAYLYRENYSGKLANPARVAVSPTGATDAQKNSFFQKVMAWGLNTVFGLPPGWDVKLIESNGQGFDVYKQTIASSDQEFMIGLAGQIVTVTGGAGFANADIHATIRSDIIQGDGDALAATLNAQGLRPIVNRLFGSRARASLKWDTRPPADLKAEAEAISYAARAIEDGNRALAAYGLQIDADEMGRRFKLPVVAVQVPAALGPAPTAVAPADENADAPSDDSAQRLAAAMTDAQVAQCEHGRPNRCPLCGIERDRSFTLDDDGTTHWNIAWRPIARRGLSIVRDAA